MRPCEEYVGRSHSGDLERRNAKPGWESEEPGAAGQGRTVVGKSVDGRQSALSLQLQAPRVQAEVCRAAPRQRPRS